MASNRTSAPDSIKVGLIGCGAIGRFRAQAIARSTAMSLVLVADERRGSADAVAATCPGVRVIDPGAMADSPDVAAVIVSTPPAGHEPLAVPCLKAGKHVLVEKPLAPTVPACERLVKAAGDANVRLATGFTLRHTPASTLAMQLVKEGAIGEIDHVRAFHGHKGGSDFGPAWITDSAVTGGGTLMDNGIHVIDLARWFLGDIADVAGYASNGVWRKPGCEDNGLVLLRAASGKLGLVDSSWSEWRGYGWRCEVYGTRGAVRFGYPPLWLAHTSGIPGERMATRRELFWRYQVEERIRGWQWSLVETLRLDLESFAEAIRAGTEPASSGRDGLAAVRIALSVDRRTVSGT